MPFPQLELKQFYYIIVIDDAYTFWVGLIQPLIIGIVACILSASEIIAHIDTFNFSNKSPIHSNSDINQ